MSLKITIVVKGVDAIISIHYPLGFTLRRFIPAVSVAIEIERIMEVFNAAQF